MVTINEVSRENMKIKAVLFDLDGTLLPMELDEFFSAYFKLLAKKLYLYGCTDPKLLVKVIWSGVEAVIKNDGSQTNEEVFWAVFDRAYPMAGVDKKALLEDFYANDFQDLKVICGYNPMADETVKKIKQKGLRTVIATKPIFPASAVESRMKWAGLETADFEEYTSYDKCSYCKPDCRYYIEIAEKMGLSPEECLMVGNDVSEDMTAEKTGMKVFLLTDCLIADKDCDISVYKNGSFKELLEYIEEIS